MKYIDAVKGFVRQIMFSERGGHTTSGGVALTGCVVEVIASDWQSRSPLLAMRFYDQPYPFSLAQEMTDGGRPAYDEDTPIGVELALGPELVRSLLSQLESKLPELNAILQEEGSAE